MKISGIFTPQIWKYACIWNRTFKVTERESHLAACDVHLYILCKYPYTFCQNMHFLVFPLQLRQTCRSNGRNVRLCTAYVSYFLPNHFTKVNMTNVVWQAHSKMRYKRRYGKPIIGSRLNTARTEEFDHDIFGKWLRVIMNLKWTKFRFSFLWIMWKSAHPDSLVGLRDLCYF